jgi:hypothetical protein
MKPEKFNERPHQSEKKEALDYIRTLMEQARRDSKFEDIPKLEKLIELVDSKRYGLVWEEHAELVEEEMKTKIPVFIEDYSRKIEGNPSTSDYNFLLEGDNLHSLHLLSKTHSGMIDVIYIDPPYNTGNKDFIYNDKIVDKTDVYSHSKWLSFMSKRLEIAKELLSDNGVIFISIDDNEQAQLKLLCDEVFGEQNFINLISVNSKVSAGASGGGEDKRLKKNIEYILIYCKSIDAIPPLKPIYKETDLMSYIQKMKSDGKSFKYTNILYEFDDIEYYKTIKDGSGDDIVIKKVNRYSIKTVNAISKLENITEQEVYLKYYDRIMTTTNAQTSIRTRVWEATDSEDNMYVATYTPKSGKNKGKTIDLIFKGRQKVLVIWLKDSSLKNKNKIVKREKIGTFWDGFSWINVSKEGKIKFENGKKPIALIMQALKLTDNRNSIVLDFFAGSGSAGHAVSQLNKEDGGNRKYILCTNNENNICEEVTYKRLLNIQKDLPHNLKYFKTKFIKKDDEDLEYALLNNVKTLIELEHAIDLEESDKAVAFTLSEIRELDLSGIKTVYVRQHSHALMEKEDKQRYENIELIDVPEYYFASEMREAGL